MKHKFLINKSMTILLTLMVLLSIVAPAMAWEDKVAQGGKVSIAFSQAEGPTDPAELEAFLDQWMTSKMEELHIAGAAVSVVKDGKVFLTKGYGFADLEHQILVDPGQTIFRIGSIGKIFTWTAVMQLVEKGMLDLDADVNSYLDFRVPDTYPQPITVRHLISHTSGFEDVLFAAGVTDEKDLVPAREWLVAHMAARVNPPGVYAGYSNFNAMLAGYIVAQVSGQPYDQYIQEHIFDPLGMTRSTVRSSMPPELLQNASVGYLYQGEVFEPLAGYYVQQGALPSGAHRLSVSDMARFMIAHLQGGVYRDATLGEARILQESTVEQMHSPLFTPDARLLGTNYGFADLSDNGLWTLGHEGYAPPMHSQLLLLPHQNLGIFVAYNSRDASELTIQHFGFQRAFFDHYFPAPALETTRQPLGSAEQLERFVGSYGEASSPQSSLAKIVGLFGGYGIKNPGDGTLLLSVRGFELRMVQQEPLYFQQVDGPFHLLFTQDDQGRITHMYTDVMPQYTLIKLDWYETPGFNQALLMISSLLFLTLLLVLPLRWFWNRRSGAPRKPASRGARLAFWLMLGISLLNLVIAFGTAAGLMGNTNELLDPPLLIRVVLGLSILSAVLTPVVVASCLLSWKDRYWGVAFRSYYTLLTCSALAFAWFMYFYNLVGWHY